MTDTPDPAPIEPKPQPSSDKPESLTIPKARFDEEVGKRRALETEYAEFSDAVLADVPDNLKPLIPADLSPAQKLKWFREAKKTGVFDAKPTVPTTDTAKPATTPKDRDLSTLPAHARIAAGYGKA